MNWTALTEDDLRDALNSAELDLYSSHAADVDVPDRMPGILEDVIAQVRGDIASCTRNTLSVEDDYIPTAYHHHALAIARYRLLATLPYCEISEDRKNEFKSAELFFKDVARCIRRPEAPENPRTNTAPTETSQPGAEVVSSRTSITGRNNLKGL